MSSGLEQHDLGQVGGLVGAVIGLVQNGVNLKVMANVNIAHVVPASGHTILGVALRVHPVIEATVFRSIA